MLSIYDRLLDTKELATFVTGLQLTDLSQTIAGTGNFTIFAPHNRAFTSLPMPTLQQLSQDLAFLTRVLNSHILSSKLEHRDLVDIYDRGHRTVTRRAIDGTLLAIDLSDGIKIGKSKILSVDISADNGIIYLIDRVLLPDNYNRFADLLCTTTSL
jgi:uncharacterized surface protein with fasciclin (FAS1) repeats